MKTLKLTSAWILICSIIAISSGTTEHASSHHVAEQAASTPQKTHPDTIVPLGVQIPEHVLSTRNVSCISADNNIFQILHEAQKACNGTDMRCTFYHFVNHGYQNIGTLDINKELFDDLLMKFDNWLLTAENIDNTHVHGKTNSLNTTNVHVKYKNEGRVRHPTDTIDANSVNTNQGKFDHNINESDDDRFHNHHIKNPDETHHRNHHYKLKNGNHVNPYTEYNKEHRYFEVFLPKDRETGKPRTIYVEVDKDKNEFILLDEDIDKKLNGIKPIKIELDELSEIADTAFGDLVKSSNHKGHIYNNVNNDNQVLTSDLNRNFAVDNGDLHLDISKDGPAENIFNSSVYDPNIHNLNVNQQLIPNNSKENNNKILSVDKNLIVPNKYINQEQIYVGSQIDNTTEDMINNNFEILQNINETDTDQAGFYEKPFIDTVEFDHNNITDLEIDNELNISEDLTKIPCENEYDNCTENNVSTDHDIVTYDDNDFIQLEDNNDTSIDMNFDDLQNVLPSKTTELNKSILPGDKLVQEVKKTPYETKLTSPLTDYTSSLLNLLSSDIKQRQTDLGDHSSESSIPVKKFTPISVLGKDSDKVVEMDSYLQSSIPVYTDLSESGSQNPVLNSDLEPALSMRDYTLSLPIGKFHGRPKSVSPDHTVPSKDLRLLPIAPSFNINEQEPLHLEANIQIAPKINVLPSKFAISKALADFDKVPATTQYCESPLSVIPYSLQQTSPNFLPTKDNFVLLKYSPTDNNLKEATVPYSSNSNRYPCNTNPYNLNPYLQSPQLIPAYFEPPLYVTPLQSTSKTPTLNSQSISLDQSHPCFNSAYPRETNPIPILPSVPNTPFPPVNPLWLGSGSFQNTGLNLWNSSPCQTVPSLPYSVLPAQNIWNSPPILNHYLAPSIDQQQNQILKPLSTEEVAKSILQQPCGTNTLQMTPSSYTPFSPIYTRPVQMDLNPSLNLERDLQTLSYKYGIPLTKILNAIEAEISGTDNQISLSPIELYHSKFGQDGTIKAKSTFPATNTVANDETRSGNQDIVESNLRNLTPLDSSLIGPHLEMDDSLLLSLNDFQTNTVVSETIGQNNDQPLNLNKKPKNKFLDSSLIGPHLPTLSTGNFQLGDEDRTGHVKLHSESVASSMMPLESSLIGPHLEIASPPEVLDSNIDKSDILPLYTEVPATSQIKTDLSDEMQFINEMIPLESDLHKLTSLDSSHVDLVNNLEQSGIAQHENTTATIDSTKLVKLVETKPNFIEGELLSKSDSSRFIPLDSSLIGPHLQTDNSPIITHALEDNSVSIKSQESIENSDTKVDEMESIILPSSMLNTLLNEPANANLNHSTISQNTKLNKELNLMNVESPITENSSITQSLKETDFQIIGPSLEITDSTILKQESKTPGITAEVNSDTQIDSFDLDSSILLDSSLIGQSLLQETDFQETSPTLDSVDHYVTYEGLQTSNLITKPLKTSAEIDSKIQFDSSLTGPSLFQKNKSQDSSTALDSVVELDDSFVMPVPYETVESSATSPVLGASSPETKTLDISRSFDSNNMLDTSLIGPHLSTAPFSNEEIKMINDELQLKSELANLEPLDSSLIGPHLDFESQLDESEISRYQNLESSGSDEEGSPLKPINLPSDLQELLSKFTNAITKSRLSPSEMKPCEKLLSSLANTAADNNYIELSSEDLQSLQDELASEFSPITIIPKPRLPSVQYSTKGQPCYDYNYYPTQITYPEYAYAKRVPQIPTTPLIDCNWVGQPLNIQNFHEALPGLGPVMENVTPFPSKDFNLLDLVSQNKLYSQPSNLNMYLPGEAISSGWSTPPNILPLNNYIPLLPKKSFTASNLGSNTEYNPIVVDDVMSLIDEKTLQLLKDILPSLTPTSAVEEVSPSLLGAIPTINTNFIKSRPTLPLTNLMGPSSLCLYNSQNYPIYNLQFSEMIGPPPKLISLPTESPKMPIELQWHKMANKPQFMESIANPILDKEGLLQLLSQSCLNSPMILPSTVLDTMLQIPTASNELKNIPFQLLPVNFSLIQTPSSNTFTNSILTSYAKPLPVSYAKPTSTLSTSLPLNLPLSANLFAPPTLPINPSPFLPEFSSPLMPGNTEPSDYRYLQTAAYNKPISSTVPYKPSQTCSSPRLPYHATSLPFDTSPYSPASVPTPYTLEYTEPMSAPYFSAVPKSLTNGALPAYSTSLTQVTPSPMVSMQMGLLLPSYVGLDTPSPSYLPLPVSTNTLERPPSVFSSASFGPRSVITSNSLSNPVYLASDPISSQNPQLTTQELQLMKSINAMPISLENKAFLNDNQMLPISRNVPTSSYSSYGPKSSPYFNSQIKQNIPYGDIIQSNLQNSLLTEEIPANDIKEINMYTYSNDKDDYYHEPNLKYPLESMSYTLAPEDKTEILSDEDFVSQEHFIPFDPVTIVSNEPSTKTNVYQRPHLRSYTPLYGNPYPAEQYLPPSSLTELIQQNVFDNVPPMPSLRPYQASLPTLIPLSQFLKPPTPVTSPSSPCIYPSEIPYSIVPINQESLFSLPNYSETSQNLPTSPITPSPAFFFQTPVSPINLSKSQPPTLPLILDNFFQLPPTYYDPKSKTLPSQNPFIKSSSIPSYNQYTAPIISHFTPGEEPYSPQFITPLSLPKNAYQHNIPPPIKFQDCMTLSKAPIHYQPYNLPAVLPSSIKNIFSPSVTSSHTALPSFNNIVEPLNTDLNKPQWSSFSPQYTLPVSLSSPIPVSTFLPVTTPQTTKPAYTNHIMPSSLFLSSDTDFQIPTKQLAPNIPKYISPLPTVINPLESVSYETSSRPLGKTVFPQNILKNNRQFFNGQYIVPQSSPPYVTQPLEYTDPYPAQLSPNIQYTTKTHPKLSPLSSYFSLPLETVPNRLKNKPTMPQYSLPSGPVYDASNKPLSVNNVFLDPDFKPILGVPSYPVQNNLILSPGITPIESILLSNLRPLEISKETLDSYSPPLTPLYSSSLPKSSVKSLPQKSRQNQSPIIPNYTQYASQFPIKSVSELLPSTSPLLKPLLANSQNNDPLYPMRFSDLDTTLPERSSTKILPSVTGEYEYSGLFAPLVTEIPEKVEPINLLSITANSLLKPQFNKHYQSPVSIANMPLYSNYNIVESSPKLPIQTSILNTAKPVEVTAISASNTSPISQYSFDSEMIEDIKPYEHMNIKEIFMPKGRLSSLPKYLSQQTKVQPALSKYLKIPQSLQNEPLVVDYTPTDKETLINKNTLTLKPNILQFSPYTTLFNTDLPPSKTEQLQTKLQHSRYGNQLSQNSPLYISPDEYKDMIKSSSITKGSISLTDVLTSLNSEPQLTTSPMTVDTHPVPSYTSPISFRPDNWFQSPILAKFLPPQEIPVEVTPEKENIQSVLNKYKLNNIIPPQKMNNYPYELVSAHKVPFKLDTKTPIPLRKSGPNTEYEVMELNDLNEFEDEMLPYELEPETIEERYDKPNSINAKAFPEILPEVVEGLSVPTYNDIAQRPQRLSKMDQFYANNHIGKSPQVFTVPAYNNQPITPLANVKSLYNVSPDILGDFTNIPTHFGYVPKLETSSLKPTESHPEIAYSSDNVPTTNSHSMNHLYPRFKPYFLRRFPTDAIKVADSSVMPHQPTSYAPNDNTEDIKYSGYKTYQMPFFKYPKSTQNLGTPTQEYNPSVLTYSSPISSVKPSNIQQIPNLYSPVEISEDYKPQYLTPVEITSPLQTKLSLNTIQEIPELEEYASLISQYENPVDITKPPQTKLGLNTLKENLESDEYHLVEDLPVNVDNENEDNELKTSLLNYINTREDVKNKLYNSNAGLTIPMGNIAITNKEPYNANTIETNNPSIGLKVWKSNVKIAKAELKLKFKDLTVNNFMPVVNNLDEYDMEEIRKIIKNYIDDKYGAHIEVNEPYTLDNKYTIIKDFDHNAVDNKYNLLWPTNYV